jgi:hypothetical protein
VQPLDRRVSDPVAGEARVQDQHVGVGVAHRRSATPVALLGSGEPGTGCRRDRRAEEAPPADPGLAL